MNAEETLIIKLTTSGDGKIKASLGNVEQGVQRVEKSTEAASDRLVSLKGILLGLATGAVAKFTFGSIMEFEKLNASLKTVTGSAQAAKTAFGWIQNFAATTPFALAEVTDAFIKMKSLGLDASESALRSYGNTASAMGKSLDQMIEAVADAATGEFERLKEFGIRASQQGNQVKFTFQGVTTTVQKNAAAISAYLKKIGNTQFAGAMDEQSKTLVGAVSNMGDSLTKLAQTVGNLGLTDKLKEITHGVTDLANSINLSLKPIEELSIKEAEYRKRVVESQLAQTKKNNAFDVNIKPLEHELELLNVVINTRKRLQAQRAQEKSNEPAPTQNAPVDQKAQARIKKEQESFSTQLDQLQNYYKNAGQIEQDAHNNREFMLLDALSRQQITEKYYNELSLKEHERYQKKVYELAAKGQASRHQLEQMGWKDKFNLSIGSMKKIIGGAANTNKEMFEANKILAEANVAVNLPDAVIQSFRNGGGFPLGLIPAGLMLKTGLAQLQAIRASRFGSSSSPPSVAGGGATPTYKAPDLGQLPSAQPASNVIPIEQKQQERVRNIYLPPDNRPLSQEYIREDLQPAIDQAVADGATSINIQAG